MAVQLVPLPSEQFSEWLRQCAAEYAADLVKTGLSKESAGSQAEGTLNAAFPTGAPTPDNTVFNVITDTSETAGYVWIGRDNSEDPTSWWVWDIVIDSAFRGRGLGRTTMTLAEDYVGSRGAATLGLSVFGFNSAARGLYEPLGYETTSVKMRKNLMENSR